MLVLLHTYTPDTLTCTLTSTTHHNHPHYTADSLLLLSYVSYDSQ